MNNQWYTSSVESSGVETIQGWVNNPSANHGFFIRPYTDLSPFDGLGIDSRESAYPPMLEVTYQ